MMASSLPLLVTTGQRPRPPPMWTASSSNDGDGHEGAAHHPSAGDNNGNQQDYENPLPVWCAWANEGHRMWVYMPDSFWVYTFMAIPCRFLTTHTHLWTECPYGLRCAYAHGVFETCLHLARFRVGRICFFAHFPAQRRNGAGIVPLVDFPPPPPLPLMSFVRRPTPRPGALRPGGLDSAAAAPALAPASSAYNRPVGPSSVGHDHPGHARSLRLLTSDSVASSSSSTSRATAAVSTATVATALPAPPLALLLQASPIVDDEEGMMNNMDVNVVALMSINLASEEGSDEEYP